jgi:hypothetical protein
MENNMQIEKLTEKFRRGTISNEEMVFLLNYLKDKEPGSEISEYYQSVWDIEEKYENDINSQSLYNEIIRTSGISGDKSMQLKESRKKISFTGNINSIMRYAAVF